MLTKEEIATLVTSFAAANDSDETLGFLKTVQDEIAERDALIASGSSAANETAAAKIAELETKLTESKKRYIDRFFDGDPAAKKDEPPTDANDDGKKNSFEGLFKPAKEEK